LNVGTPSPTPRYAGTANLVVESDAGPVSMSRMPQWRVVSLDLLTADDPPEDPRRQMMEGMGGPGGKMPPRFDR
jgi:hypothetical protein